MRRVPLPLMIGLLVVLAGASGVLGFWLRERMIHEDRDWRTMVAEWQHPEGLPDLPLVDQDGRHFGLRDLEHSWVLVGFIFTRCERAEACPLTMTQMASVQEAWGSRDPALELLTLTIDPSFDSPEVLTAYGQRFGRQADGWTLATGEQELMTHGLPSLFNVIALPSEEGFDHTVKLALLSPGLRLEREWKDGTFSVASLREAVRASP